MKKLICIFLVFGSAVTQADPYMLLPIDDVYDGDTIKTHIHPGKLPPPLNKLSIRIRGIDTPEMPARSYFETGKLGRAKCDQEALNAIAARDAVRKIVQNTSARKMKVTSFKWGSRGGRIIADVKIGGVDIAQFLLAKGYAVPYDGKSKRNTNWCI